MKLLSISDKCKRKSQQQQQRRRRHNMTKYIILMVILMTRNIITSHAFSTPATTTTTTSVKLFPISTNNGNIKNQNNCALSTLPTTKRKRTTLSATTTTTAANAVSLLIQSFTSSSGGASLPSAIADLAIQTPPIAYFLALLSAGFGVPISEDALCIFSGAVILPSLSLDKHLQVKILLALYGGVVLSDIVTFVIGRSLRLGIMDPLRNYLNLSVENKCEINEEGVEVCTLEPSGDTARQKVDEAIVGSTGIDGLSGTNAVVERLRKRDRIKSKIMNAGDYIGFVTRLSVGVRGPIMLLSGFTGSVSLWKFMVGSAVGACVSLPVQLYMGYFMRDNPGAVVSAIAGISTVAIGVPFVIAVGTWMGMLVNRVRRRSSSSV